jgi:hypothetical protein
MLFMLFHYLPIKKKDDKRVWGVVIGEIVLFFLLF